MKKLLSLSIAVFLTLSLTAQTVQESVASIGEINVPSCTVSVQKDAKMVKKAMDQYLKDARLKTSKQQGYVAAINQNVATISAGAISLYTKVEEQGKRNNKTTVVTVAVIGNDLTVDQSDLRDNAKSWLADFVQYISRFEASQQMAVEQENLKKAQKAAASANAAAAAIDKAILKDQEKIASKRQEIEKLKEKIKTCEQDIINLQADIEKQNKKKSEADAKANAANQNVNNVQSEVDRYRQMSE